MKFKSNFGGGIMIKEVIVVEGKNDIAAVKKAVDAEVIATSGFGLNDAIMEKIKNAAMRCGIIVLTDPDFSGEKIRRMVQEEIKDAKHAFLPRELALKDGDIGIENASPESIREALSKVKTEVGYVREEFNYSDLVKNGLTDCTNASHRRDVVGKGLGIGYCNSKQFLNRLNRYGIERKEFEMAIEKLKELI